MLYIIYQEDREDGESVRAAERERHLAYLERHKDLLVLGGALLAEDGKTRTGSCLVINVPSHAPPRRSRATSRSARPGSSSR